MPDPTPKLTIDVERLRSVLHYEPTTGAFTWRVRRGRVRPGQVAGRVGNRGYVKILLAGEYWLAHRLAWAIVHGALPNADRQIDHINRVRHDNRLANLRLVTQSENILNSDHFGCRRTQSRGTTFIARTSRWQAQISIQGRNTYLGLFVTEAEAHAAYCNAIPQS